MRFNDKDVREFTSHYLTTCGIRLRHTREDRGWSQWKLAQLADVSQGMVSAIELGKTEPALAIRCKLALALCVQHAEIWPHPDINTFVRECKRPTMEVVA